MRADGNCENAIGLGDPAPWFSARSLAGSTVELQVNAGRWIVLVFVGALSTQRGTRMLDALLANAARLDEDRIVAFAVLTERPADGAAADALGNVALSIIADDDGGISRLYGASDAPRTIVLDPMLRVVANIADDHPQGHAELLTQLLADLPDVDDSAGVPLTAPVLIVPRVFEFPFCELLVNFYEEHGGAESGFLLDSGGKTQTVVDRRYKSRRDLAIVAPELREAVRERVVRRLNPEVERFFQFKATRMDRYMVSCYESAYGGHFSRHRDNVNAGARHRRFAASINLNDDYEGCELVFPEFGRRRYRAPVGGAIVFSCGALHQVTPVTRGRRYAFVPFFYGEDDSALRIHNNCYLRAGEPPYTGERDRLFPSLAPDISEMTQDAQKSGV
ncbi:MAG: 2OG-Fe(II) oxygenase [Proteobacteria bacterium]|nr:2OG-Fe(II) oxygenase [Pseudomonadota bacterium]